MSQEMVVSFPGGKRVTATYGGFQLQTDQSPEHGGEGSAPEPFDLFLASLATCAGVYVIGFCDRRSIAHDGIRIIQRWQRKKDGKLACITLDIEIPESFPEKYRDALVRSANQCSVKKTIENPPDFVVRWSKPEPAATQPQSG